MMKTHLLLESIKNRKIGLLAPSSLEITDSMKKFVSEKWSQDIAEIISANKYEIDVNVQSEVLSTYIKKKLKMTNRLFPTSTSLLQYKEQQGTTYLILVRNAEPYKYQEYSATVIAEFEVFVQSNGKWFDTLFMEYIFSDYMGKIKEFKNFEMRCINKENEFQNFVPLVLNSSAVFDSPSVQQVETKVNASLNNNLVKQGKVQHFPSTHMSICKSVTSPKKAVWTLDNGLPILMSKEQLKQRVNGG